MPWLDRFHGLETEIDPTAPIFGGNGLEPEPQVVTEVEAVEHAAREPARRRSKDGDALRPLRPVAELELVDLVARLAAEQLRQLALCRTEEVHDDRVRLADHVECAVLLRDAREEARRLDAALRCEADQAAGPLAIDADGGDYVHRPVQAADELLEVALAQAAKSATRSRTPWSVCDSSLRVIASIRRIAAKLSDRIAAVKRLMPRPRASSASRMLSALPMPLPCMWSATVTATSAASRSSRRRT